MVSHSRLFQVSYCLLLGVSLCCLAIPGKTEAQALRSLPLRQGSAPLQSAGGMYGGMMGMCGMGGTLYAPLAFGQFQPDGEMKHAIEVLLEEQYKKVRILLESNREAVMAIAEALLIQEELDGDEVLEIIREVEERIARQQIESLEPVAVGAGVSTSGHLESNGYSGNGYSGNGHSGNGNGHSATGESLAIDPPAPPQPPQSESSGDYPGAALG